MKIMLTLLASVGLSSAVVADMQESADSRALLYMEMPLAAGVSASGARSTFGFRMESNQLVESRRWPLIDLRLQHRGVVQLRLSGVPVLRYDGSVEDSFSVPESLEDVPWWGWGLGALAVACLAEAGICEDDGNGGGTPSGGTSPGCGGSPGCE